MQPLRLPPFEFKVKNNQIFCLVRKKWIVLTPEEWVRQHFLNLLFNHLLYPKGLTQLEHSISYFKHAKRSDIVILDKEGKTYLLVECKSPSVKLNQKVLRQISTYNKVLDSKYLAITNGNSHFVWEKKEDVFIQISEFPSFTSHGD